MIIVEDLERRFHTLSSERKRLLELYLGLDAQYAFSKERSVPYKHGLYAGSELRIKLQKEVNSYLYRAYPVCIITAYANLIPWYASRNIQLCAQTYSDGYIVPDYMESEFYYLEVLDHAKFTYEQLNEMTDNIVNYIIDQINKGYYVNIFLDEYYLENKSRYLKEHFVHENLIYGYDNSTRKFKTVGLDKNDMFNLFTHEYDELRLGFEEGKKHYMVDAPYAAGGALHIIKVKDTEKEHIFEQDIFLNRINSFLCSEGDLERVNLPYRPGFDNEKPSASNMVYGLEVILQIVKRLRMLANGEVCLDYRAIHLVSEHGKGLYNKLKFIAECPNVPGGIADPVNRYIGTAELFERLRIKALELLYNRDIGSIEFKENLDEIIGMLENGIESEKQLLGEVYKILREGKERRQPA